MDDTATSALIVRLRAAGAVMGGTLSLTGTGTALDEFVRTRLGPLLGKLRSFFARRLATMPKEEIEDLVQDVIEALWKSQNLLDMKVSHEVYAFGVATKLVAEHKRRFHWVVRVLGAYSDTWVSLDALDSAIEIVIQGDSESAPSFDHKRVTERLARQLQAEQFSVLSLAALGFSDRELAAHFDATEPAIRKRLERARARAREILGESGMQGPDLL